MKLIKLALVLLGFILLSEATISCSMDEELETQVHSTGDEADDIVEPDEDN